MVTLCCTTSACDPVCHPCVRLVGPCIVFRAPDYSDNENGNTRIRANARFCLFVCFIASHHSLSHLRLQQYTTTVYVFVLPNTETLVVS